MPRPKAELRRGGGPIRSAEAWMGWTELEKLLLTTEGTDVEQRFVYGGAGHAGDRGRRRWQHAAPLVPRDARHRTRYRAATKAWPRRASASKRRAFATKPIALLDAPPCPAGARDVILASSQMALQIHESCGHPSELDRALGSEISLAGGSFLQPEHLGKLRYGSPIVTLTADSTAQRGLGTFGWDDEGTPARKSRAGRATECSSTTFRRAKPLPRSGGDSTGTVRAVQLESAADDPHGERFARAATGLARRA